MIGGGTHAKLFTALAEQPACVLPTAKLWPLCLQGEKVLSEV